MGGGSRRPKSGAGKGIESLCVWYSESESLETGRDPGWPKNKSVCEGTTIVSGRDTEQVQSTPHWHCPVRETSKACEPALPALAVVRRIPPHIALPQRQWQEPLQSQWQWQPQPHLQEATAPCIIEDGWNGIQRLNANSSVQQKPLITTSLVYHADRLQWVASVAPNRSKTTPQRTILNRKRP